MEIFFTGIALLVIGGLLTCLFKETIKFKILALFSCIASILLIISAILPSKPFYFQNPIFGNVGVYNDSLSSFFIIIISIITMLSSIYSNGYMEYLAKNKKITAHCFFYTLLTAAMLMVVTVQNAFFFLIMWEIMSLSSFFLVIFEDDKKEVLSAGIKYLIYMHISVVFIISAFVLMSIKSGSYDFSTFKSVFVSHPYLKDIIFILSFVGFGIKAGFFPMHNWLPEAHPAAPSHVSAVMSAVMIKTGIYGILKVLTFIDMPTPFITYTVLFISVLTAVYGIIYAITQKDIKKLLAYSSVENIGIIGLAISLIMFGKLYHSNLVITLATFGCFMHILNHSVFKCLLFMGVGSIYRQTHTKNIEQLGGLIKKMPYTAVFFLFAGVAICAFPPLNGFISEFLIYGSMFSVLKLPLTSLSFISIVLAIASLALVGTLVILAMTKIYSVAFLGNPRSDYSKNAEKDVPKSMLIPMGILAILTFVISILSPFGEYIIPLNLYADYNQDAIFRVSVILLIITMIVSSFLIFIIIMCLIKRIVIGKSKQYKTWGCGYNKSNSSIQYTASSYVYPFSSILTPIFKKVYEVKKPKGIFPQNAYYNSEIQDVEEAYLINPIIKYDEKILTKFERLQDGNIQHYILYGLIFLILMLIGAAIC